MSLAMDRFDEHLSHVRAGNAACLQILRLVSGFDSKVRSERRFVIVDTEGFQAVLDESGYQAAAGNDVFIFAGYVGKMADWADLTHKWEPILAEHPELADSEIVKGLVRWRGRHSDPRALKLMKAVTGCAGLGSIRWRLPYADYRSVVVTNLLGGDENIYFFGWLGVLFNVLAVIRHIPHVTVDLLYDENIVEEPKVQTGYEEVRKWLAKYHPELLSMLPRRPTPRNDKDFWPLRAADALAWNTHRAFMQTQRNEPHSNELWAILDSGPKAIDETWNGDDVREVLVGRLRDRGPR